MPSQTGLILTTQPILMAIVAPISGQLSDRMGARTLGMVGMAVLAVGLWLLSRLTPQSAMSEVTLALAVAGLGTGTFIAPNSSALMGAAPRHRQGIAAGVLASARNVGMVLGVGLAGAVFTTMQAQTASVVTAVTTSFAVAIGLAVLGIFTSAIRAA